MGAIGIIIGLAEETYGIITDDGFKICEINSLPGLDIEQVMFGPLLDNEVARQFYLTRIN